MLPRQKWTRQNVTRQNVTRQIVTRQNVAEPKIESTLGRNYHILDGGGGGFVLSWDRQVFIFFQKSFLDSRCSYVLFTSDNSKCLLLTYFFCKTMPTLMTSRNSLTLMFWRLNNCFEKNCFVLKAKRFPKWTLKTEKDRYEKKIQNDAHPLLGYLFRIWCQIVCLSIILKKKKMSIFLTYISPKYCMGSLKKCQSIWSSRGHL